MMSPNLSEVPEELLKNKNVYGIVIVRRTSHSYVISLPKELSRDLGWSIGDRIMFYLVPIKGAILVGMTKVNRCPARLSNVVRHIRRDRYSLVVTIPKSFAKIIPKYVKLVSIGDNSVLIVPEGMNLSSKGSVNRSDVAEGKTEDKNESNRKTRKDWTPEELELLKRYYPYMSNSDLSVILNRSEASIRNKAKELGLRKVYPNFPKHLKKILIEKYAGFRIDFDSL